MTKYRLKGLDCANCAARIETELRTRKGFEFATVNFAAGTLALDSDAEETVRSILKSVEPGIELVRHETGVPAEDFSSRPALLRMTAAGLLLAAGILFSRQLETSLGGLAAWLVLLPAYLLVGSPVLLQAGRDLLRGRLFNEMFLMAIATIGALALGELQEAVGVMLFYSVGEYLQEKAVAKSRRSIASLMDLRPEFARVEGRLVEPELVAVGAVVEVLPGERIPLDGSLVEGSSFVDTSSLTGESVPRSVAEGDRVRAGYINESGRILVRVEAPFAESSVARILDLVENAAANKAPTETFMTKVAAVYTPFVVISATLLAFVPPLLIPGAVFSEWLYRALVLLVISCPCALVISIPLGYFGGVGSASKHKILLKGAYALDSLLKVDTVVFDKTGTLTKGSYEVTAVEPAEGMNASELIGFAAAAERYSLHPAARALRAYAGKIDAASGQDVQELVEEKGRGVRAFVDGHEVRVGRRAFVAPGPDETSIVAHAEDPSSRTSGTLVHVGIDGRYAGRILIADSVKEEAAGTLRSLKRMGAKHLVMLTGDRDEVASQVGRQLGLDAWYSELLPEQKVERLDELKQALQGGKIVFVGDGMNDAPVLMRSDLGIAMGGLGSDAAIEASDIVIMDDRIERIPLAMRIAAKTRRIVQQNIVFALGIKGAFLLAGAFGAASMWEAVIADVGVALLAVLNSIRAASIQVRNTEFSQAPRNRNLEE